MSGTWVDFKAVKAAVPIERVLEHYKLTGLKKEKNELVGKCPIHQGEGQRTFHVSVTKNAFNCFSCKAKGNVLELVAAIEKCSVRDAALKLQEWFSVPKSEQTAGPAVMPVNSKQEPAAAVQTSSTDELINKPLGFELKSVDPAHPYLQSRGFDKDLCARFGIGYFSGKGSMAGRVVIPIHDEAGDLVAYAGRAIDDTEPKYKLPAGFHKSLVLYNLPRTKEGSGTVVLVEGFFDCLRLVQAGRTAVALMGCTMSVQQEEILCRLFERVVIMLDGDEAGKLAAAEVAARLQKRVWVRVIEAPEGRQPDQLSTEEIGSVLKGIMDG